MPGSTPDVTRPTLADQPSVSALNVARCRAIAAHEPREAIKGPDYLAEVFLGDEAQQSLKDPAMHALILKKLAAFSPGGYEFFIARTAYMDRIVAQALRDGIPQIVFLGAGYDTRAYRFCHLIHSTHIFELDNKATQQHKRSLLEQAHVPIPVKLTFVTINFNRDDMAAVLAKAGYASDKKTLFIWEGVSYYLPPETVYVTLNFVRRNSPAGSTICFDYMLTEAELPNRFGAVQGRAAMKATFTAEPLQFDLANASVVPFLTERGFRVIEHLTTADMQRRYLTLPDGSLAGDVLDLFGLVLAVVQ